MCIVYFVREDFPGDNPTFSNIRRRKLAFCRCDRQVFGRGRSVVHYRETIRAQGWFENRSRWFRERFRGGFGIVLTVLMGWSGEEVDRDLRPGGETERFGGSSKSKLEVEVRPRVTPTETAKF